MRTKKDQHTRWSFWFGQLSWLFQNIFEPIDADSPAETFLSSVALAQEEVNAGIGKLLYYY